MIKRSVSKPADLSAEEVRGLDGLSLVARVTYLIAFRPYANAEGIVTATDKALEARLGRVYSDDGFDAVRFDAELAKLVKRNRITPAYRDAALNLVSVVY